MYQSKIDLIKQYQYAVDNEDEPQAKELYLEVLIDIRDILCRLHETYTWVQRKEK